MIGEGNISMKQEPAESDVFHSRYWSALIREKGIKHVHDIAERKDGKMRDFVEAAIERYYSAKKDRRESNASKIAQRSQWISIAALSVSVAALAQRVCTG